MAEENELKSNERRARGGALARRSRQAGRAAVENAYRASVSRLIIGGSGKRNINMAKYQSWHQRLSAVWQQYGETRRWRISIGGMASAKRA